MSESAGDILRQGIARNAGAVLCLPSAGMTRHHATRFLAESESGFYIESPGDDRPLLEQLIADQSPVNVTFKAAAESISFDTPICLRQEAYRINDQIAVDALLLRFPEHMKPLQRRAHYRVVLPEGHALQVRMWRISDHAVLRDRPLASQETVVRCKNLSVGGLGFDAVPRSGQPPKLVENERLRISMNFNEIELLVEGRARYVHRLSDTLFSAGLQFKKLEKDIEGRQILSKLTSIVGQLQRDEIRRRRGLSS